MVILMGIEADNKEIEAKMRDLAKGLLSEGKVDVVIGYKAGTLPLMSQPITIDKAEDVDKLVWNNSCHVNLAKYLVPRIPKLCGPEGNKKVGIVAKGCVGRALNLLSSENKLDLKDLIMIGIPCNGVVNRQRILKDVGEKDILEVTAVDNNIIVKGKGWEKSYPYEEYLNNLCQVCQIKSPPITAKSASFCVGECKEYGPIVDDFKDVLEHEAKSADEKWDYINDELSICTRCYACREACPMCYCNLCFVDQNKPVWFGKTTDISDILMFHLIRGFHMAGRCVGCGACTSVCPMGIDLNKINRKLEEVVKKRFKYTSGLDPDKVPPMVEFSSNDGQEFMLEED